ncbi:hypothetical protein M0638_09995 [Roseomonas sp. NAR14]|uniref:Uncharacterized protein n=1 Tax=Roseomonas acroporae TaxID=2937791 RepID=A0A9X1Y9Q4_9PROT|nr:hypothetical protein [Roseomonas acroporae]MCK8784712.1 hypothetical protein [Roseomonas acroporae]
MSGKPDHPEAMEHQVEGAQRIEQAQRKGAGAAGEPKSKGGPKDDRHEMARTANKNMAEQDQPRDEQDRSRTG